MNSSKVSWAFVPSMVLVGLVGCNDNPVGPKETGEPTNVSIIYNGNLNTGGMVPVDPRTYQAGDSVTVLDNTGHLTRSGHLFGGWNSSANSNGSSFLPGQKLAFQSGDRNLYAKWLDESIRTKYVSDMWGLSFSYPMEFTILSESDSIATSGGVHAAAPVSFFAWSKSSGSLDLIGGLSISMAWPSATRNPTYAALEQAARAALKENGVTIQKTEACYIDGQISVLTHYQDKSGSSTIDVVEAFTWYGSAIYVFKAFSIGELSQLEKEFKDILATVKLSPAAALSKGIAKTLATECTGIIELRASLPRGIEAQLLRNTPQGRVR